MRIQYPLQFEEIVQTYLFGGTQIGSYFPAKRLPPLPRIAESWEVCKDSVVIGGPLRGKTLEELCETYGEELLGTDIVSKVGTRFPLLLKFLDATVDLELSVHPDQSAVASGLTPLGKSKYEAWYVIDCSSDCRFRCGTKQGVNARLFTQAAADGRAADFMNEFTAAPGDAVYVPGGRLHGIGSRSLVAEIQDNDGDFHLFEWPYDDYSEAEKTTLIQGSLRFADLEDHDTGKTVPITIEAEKGILHTFLVACSRFSLERYDVSKPLEFHLDGRRFIIVTCIAGQVSLEWETGQKDLAPGTTTLLPASMRTVRITPDERASILCSYVPDLTEDVVKPLAASGVDKETIMALGGGVTKNDIRLAMR